MKQYVFNNMSVCFLALAIRHANSIPSVLNYIVKGGLSGCTTFFNMNS